MAKSQMNWDELCDVHRHAALHLIDQRDLKLYLTAIRGVNDQKKATKRSVLKAVQNRLNAVGHGIKFDILEAGVRADGDWWYVPVLSRLHGKDVKRDVTVSVFATVENQLHTDDGITVLLVPVVE